MKNVPHIVLRKEVVVEVQTPAYNAKRMTVVNFKNICNYRDKINCKTQQSMRQ